MVVDLDVIVVEDFLGGLVHAGAFGADDDVLAVEFSDVPDLGVAAHDDKDDVVVEGDQGGDAVHVDAAGLEDGEVGFVLAEHVCVLDGTLCGEEVDRGFGFGGEGFLEVGGELVVELAFVCGGDSDGVGDAGGGDVP